MIGVAASIVANVLAAPDNALARTISAWPAIALLLVVEMLSRSGKPRGVPNGTEDQTGTARYQRQSDSGIAPAFQMEQKIKPAPRKAPARQSAADRVAKAVARTPGATPAEVAARLKVSERTVTRALAGPG